MRVDDIVPDSSGVSVRAFEELDTLVEELKELNVDSDVVKAVDALNVES